MIGVGHQSVAITVSVSEDTLTPLPSISRILENFRMLSWVTVFCSTSNPSPHFFPQLLSAPARRGKDWNWHILASRQFSTSYLRVNSIRSSCFPIGQPTLRWMVYQTNKKSCPEPIIFWKYQCALMDHNIFMNRIGSIVVLLNHWGNFLGRIFFFFNILVAFCIFFHAWKPCFWIFTKKNFLVTQILKGPTVKYQLYC